MTLALILIWHFWVVDAKVQKLNIDKLPLELLLHFILFALQTGPVLLILWLAGVDING